MKKFFENNPLIHFTSVLTLIAIACGLIIGLVNLATSKTITANQEAKAKEAYSTLLFETSYGDQYDAWAEDYVAPELSGFQVFWNKLTQEPSEGVPSIEEWKELENIPFSINDYSFTDELGSNDPASISAKEKVLDKDGKLVGYIFQATGTNGYGDMTIVVLVGADGTILNATFQTLNQTLNLDRTRANLELFIGTKIAAVTPSGDMQSGATYSKNTMTDLLSNVATSFASVEGLSDINPLDTYLGEGFVIENDATFTETDHVSAKQNITTSPLVPDGYIYIVTGTGDYEGYDGTHSGSITLNVIFNANDQIVAIYVPEDLYQHTKSYMDKNSDYLDEFVGKTLAEISTVVNKNSDLKTGATYSRTLIDSILEALVSEVA